MENTNHKTTAKELIEEITIILKDELVATYKQEETALQMHLLSGQNFRIVVEEIK